MSKHEQEMEYVLAPDEPVRLPGQAEIERLKADVAKLQARLADWENDRSTIMNERCGDERHCACVPDLRGECERLREERDNIQNSHRTLWKAFRSVINDTCTCGGSGPEETDCAACGIYHRVVAVLDAARALAATEES